MTAGCMVMTVLMGVLDWKKPDVLRFTVHDIMERMGLETWYACLLEG
jgi:hypothetical protein